MAQANNSSRAAALARRKALSSGGKAALAQQGNRVRSAPERPKPEPVASNPAPVVARPAPASPPASSYRPRISAVAAPANSSRAAALQRRKALSSKGKIAARSQDRTRDQVQMPRSQKASATAASKAETTGCGCGCGGKDRAEAPAASPVATTPKAVTSRRSARNNSKPKVALNPSKAAALARRKALSSRGKAGMSAGGMTQAQTARAANPTLSGRELAQTLRQERSQRGKGAVKKSRPSGRQRAKPEVGPAQDASWKVGASQTARGQTVTGTMVGRDKDVTGDEASTCRVITGTEYMGADLFREFCQAEPSKSPMRTGISATTRGNPVTGNEVGRSSKVTGDEPGTCKNVTGTEYLAAGLMESFCGVPSQPAPMRGSRAETRKGKTVTGNNVGSSAKVTGGEAGAGRTLTGAQYVQDNEPRPAPAKVQVSQTLRGRSVTGTAIGRSDKTTGDEPGACRKVTGDDYIGLEQFSGFCNTQVEPADEKVGASTTFNGMTVTGTMEGRSNRVTGNEPGTCKTITGTPYAGVENYAGFCEPSDANRTAARTQRIAQMAGKNLTGQQPSVAGNMTGDAKGACENVTGTAYIGADQMAQACPAMAAEPSSSDFPQAVGDTTGWGEFSVATPSHAAAQQHNTGVTGTRYEQGHITGPFGMANGKVTGTEDARFGNQSFTSIPVNELPEPELIEGRVKSRITGEGMDAGTRITGDDWDRGDRVTGTEGFTARSRNPSLRGPTNAAASRTVREAKSEAPRPVSRVTGSSGNYENGALITYSGGARG